MSDAAAASVVDRVVTSTRLPLGAPGLYLLNEAPVPALGAQRMDVAVFVGVAPRGPAYVPVIERGDSPGARVTDPAWPRARSVAVPVASLDEYRRRFGGFDGPGLLPHAVAAFFAEGGRRAYVVRIVAPKADPLLGLSRATVEGVFTMPIEVLARDEGPWGDRLTVEVRLARTRLAPTVVDGPLATSFPALPIGALLFERPTDAPAGTLLSLSLADGTRPFAFIDRLETTPDARSPAILWHAVLDAVPAALTVAADEITATVVIRDGAGVEERFDGLGLDPLHPRFMADVLAERSTLVSPAFDWAESRLVPASPDVELVASSHAPFSGGDARYGELVPDHVLDPFFSPAEDTPGEGIAAASLLRDATQLVVPDLYVAAGTLEADDPDAAPSGSAVFAPCVATAPAAVPTSVPPSALAGMILDPRHAGDRATIAGLQLAVAAFARERSLVALLDVPPGLRAAEAEAWRALFDTSYAAAYHPFLRPARAPDGGPIRALPPSAVAAGIIARKELASGVQAGPANEVAFGAVALEEPVPAALLDRLHPAGINAFRLDPDGIRLVSARTLSRQQEWRQLSVRRLLLMLRRTLEVELQWTVFEPNGRTLRRDITHATEAFLRQLYRAGAFRGATENEAFFVRVTQGLRAELGELLIEIGVAPSEPLEFIILRLRRRGDGTLGEA